MSSRLARLNLSFPVAVIDDLGGKVLDCIGKRNELTPLGLDVLARARHIGRDAAELRPSRLLAAKFMSKAKWDAMLLADGYCGIAWQLHMKETEFRFNHRHSSL